jgi:predicted ArsR family transcriptional regulator
VDARRWRQRMLASTRGRVVSLLRRGPQTVNELAATLGLTDNGVRLHLSALERDGLVEQEGVRRGPGKPAHVFRLTAEADALFPKAYATVLAEVLGRIREERGPAGLQEFLHAVGRRAGERARADGSTLRERVDAAVVLLGELGGLAEAVEGDDAITIRGFSCPLAAVVATNPEACGLAQELVAGVIGARVEECCDRSGGPPRCSFRIARKEEAGNSPA